MDKAAEVPDGLSRADVRSALGDLIDGCRQEAWAAMRRDGEQVTVPLSWLVRHTEALCDLDRALAAIERRDGNEMRAAT